GARRTAAKRLTAGMLVAWCDPVYKKSASFPCERRGGKYAQTPLRFTALGRPTVGQSNRRWGPGCAIARALPSLPQSHPTVVAAAGVCAATPVPARGPLAPEPRFVKGRCSAPWRRPGCRRCPVGDEAMDTH